MATCSEGDAPVAASTDLFFGVVPVLDAWSAAGVAVVAAEAKSGAARTRRTENILTGCTHAELSDLLVNALIWCDDGTLHAADSTPIDVAQDGARSLVCRSAGGDACRVRFSELATRACTFLPGVTNPAAHFTTRLGLQARVALEFGTADAEPSRVTGIRLTVEGICEAAPVTPAELGESLGMAWKPFEREVTTLSTAALAELTRRLGACFVPVDGGSEVLMLLRELGPAAGGLTGIHPGGEGVAAATLAQLAFGLCGLPTSEAMAAVALGATTAVSVAGKAEVAQLAPLAVTVTRAVRYAKATVGEHSWPSVMLMTIQQLLGTSGPLAAAPPPRRIGATLRAVLHSRRWAAEGEERRREAGIRADFNVSAGGGAEVGSVSPRPSGASESALVLSPVSRIELQLAEAKEAKRARLLREGRGYGADPAASGGSYGGLPLTLTMAAGGSSARTGGSGATGEGGREPSPPVVRYADPWLPGHGVSVDVGHGGVAASVDPPPLGDFHGSQFSVAFLPARVARMEPGEALRALGVNVPTLASRFSAIARSGRQEAEDIFDGLPSVPDNGLALEAAADYARAMAMGMVAGWVSPAVRPADDQTAIQRLRSFYRSAAARAHASQDKGNAGVCELRPLDKDKVNEFTARMQAVSPAAVARITTRAVRVQEELVDATGRAEPLADARRQVEAYGSAAVAFLTSSRRTDGPMAGELIDGRPAPAMVPASFERNRLGLVGFVVARLEEFQGRDRVFSKAVGPKLGERIATFAASFLRGEVDVAEAVRLMGGEPSRPGAINQAVVFRSADKATLMGRDGVEHTDPRFLEDFKRAMRRLEALTVDVIGRALGASYAQRDVRMEGLETSGPAPKRGHFHLAPDPLTGEGGDTLLDKCLRLEPAEMIRAVQRCFEHLHSLLVEQRHSESRVHIDLCECQRVAAQLVDGDSSMAGLAVQQLLRQELDRRGVKEKSGAGVPFPATGGRDKVVGKHNKTVAPAASASGSSKQTSPPVEESPAATSDGSPPSALAASSRKVSGATESKGSGASLGKRVPKSLEAGSPAAAVWAQVAAGQKAESLDLRVGTFTSFGEMHTLYMTMLTVEKGLSPSAKLGDTAPCFWEAVITGGCRQAASSACARCRTKASWEPVPPMILKALKTGAAANLRDRVRGVNTV